MRGAAAAELWRFVLAPAALEPANGVMQHPQRRPETAGTDGAGPASGRLACATRWHTASRPTPCGRWFRTVRNAATRV
jgi:hypothetical protein